MVTEVFDIVNNSWMSYQAPAVLLQLGYECEDRKAPIENAFLPLRLYMCHSKSDTSTVTSTQIHYLSDDRGSASPDCGTMRPRIGPILLHLSASPMQPLGESMHCWTRLESMKHETIALSPVQFSLSKQH